MRGPVTAMVSVAMMLGGCNLMDAKLPDGEAEAAKTCWPAASAEAMKSDGIDLAEMAEIMVYASVAAKYLPGDKGFVDKTAEVTNAQPDDAAKAKIGLTSASLLTKCRARFTAATAAPPPLPTDPIDRNMYCLIAGSFMTGAMQGAKANGYPEKDRLARVSATAQNALNDDLLATRGITTPEQFNAYRDKMAATAMMYRLDKIAAMCPDTAAASAPTAASDDMSTPAADATPGGASH